MAEFRARQGVTGHNLRYVFDFGRGGGGGGGARRSRHRIGATLSASFPWNGDLGDRILVRMWSVEMRPALIVAQGFGFEPSFIHTMMREGEIPSLCERGVNEDWGAIG